jgi:hypothetical protein
MATSPDVVSPRRKVTFPDALISFAEFQELTCHYDLRRIFSGKGRYRPISNRCTRLRKKWSRERAN